MNLRVHLRLGVFCLAGFSSPSPAEEAKGAKPQEKSSVAKLSTEFSFDGSLIQGERIAPSGSIIQESAADQSYDFVTVRHNWRKKMLRSVATLKGTK